jgi:hypothetical protein
MISLGCCVSLALGKREGKKEGGGFIIINF